GHEFGTKQPGWSLPSAEWVREAEQLVAFEAKLPAFLKGEFQPGDTAERLGLIGVCQVKKHYAAAARLFADAFAADPKLPGRPTRPPRPATSPPVPARWPPPGRGKTRPDWTTRKEPVCESKPSTG